MRNQTPNESVCAASFGWGYYVKTEESEETERERSRRQVAEGESQKGRER